MKIFKFILPLTVLLFFASVSVISQHNNFRQWSVEDGLLQSNIYCIIQDQRGYLWIGTGGGLSLFDGKKFTNYTKKEGLSGNTVRSIMEDSNGSLWMGTDEGITVYDGYKFRKILESDGLAGSTVLCFQEDFEKNIWAGTDDGGINKITPLGKDSFAINIFNEETGLSNNSVFDLYEDHNHALWVATFSGINVLSQVKGKYEIVSIHGKAHIPSDMLLNITPDNQGGIWFGTYDAGAFKLGLDKNKKVNDQHEVISYNSSNGLNGNAVWDILFTKSGDLWFGTTENGINRLKAVKERSEYQIYSYTTSQGIPSNQILCLFEDNEGNIWIGTNGDGLCMLPGDHFAHYTEKDGLPNKIQHIQQDSLGNYWLASDGGGLAIMNFSSDIPLLKRYTEKEGLSSNFLTSLAIGKAENHNIWIGTASQGIIKFDGKHFTSYKENNGLISNRVNSLIIDANGIVWCGTAGGVSRYDGIKFLNVSTDKMMMDDEGVKTIIQDKRGNVWFGTAGGLARYTGDGALRTFDEVEGLMHKDVNAIAEDVSGNIFIGTNGGGLYKFNVNKNDTNALEFVAGDSLLSSNSINALTFLNDQTLIVGTYKGFDKITFNSSGKIIKTRNYNFTDGFIGVECNDNSIHKDIKGNVWFGTIKGFTRYSPFQEREITSPPKVYITGLHLFYKNVDWSSKADSILPWSKIPYSLSLPHHENTLTFHFSAISLSNPEKLQFRYILEGRDNDWSPARPDKEVTFSGLTHGNYTFKVKALNASGNWSEPSVFSFIISPPWYQTTWFYFTCIVVIIALIYGYIKYREMTLKEEKKLLEEIVTQRTSEVVKQKEMISEKNREITDSINYAKGIQEAILPVKELMKQAFPQSFILFKPKDIVSGDFYWMEKLKDKALFAAADCTGHGVPGAFVSMIGANGLNRSVKEYGITEPAKILDRLSALVEETFSKRKDGMDIALCAIDTKNNTLEYAGANNPMYLIRENVQPLIWNGSPIDPTVEKDGYALYEIKADKQPIGSFEGRKNFNNHIIKISPEDIVYVFTDGYADQFGGPNGKKFKYSKLKELLLSLYKKPMEEQEEILNRTIEEWKGEEEQIDDICIISVKI